MTLRKRLAVLMLVPVLLMSLALPVRAADDTDSLLCKLINYFQYYQDAARTDYDLILEEIAQQDPALAQCWSGIMDFWIWLNRDMEVHTGVLPDDLPEDDSLCIVVMGYYLHSDGRIRDQLRARLEVTLASAQKYPNAYILCTGGGTASENAKVTEASQMAQWLMDHGIPESRIILEDKARSTIENAVYGSAQLYRDYPTVKNLAVITSDYHIFRSCLYFNTQAALDAHALGMEPIRVLANATCPIDPDAPSDIDTQVEGMCLLTDLKAYKMAKPKLSKLESIQVSGAEEYPFGVEPNLTVTAFYSGDHSRDVTAEAHFAGFDFAAAGEQTVTVSYTEADVTATTDFQIHILPPPTEAPTEAPTEPATQTPSESPSVPASLPEAPASEPDLRIPAAVGCGLLILLLVLLRHRNRRKHRRKKPQIHLD